jgi:murein DD-endopeptidase MepM/ murein hydrolase activator NlpD
MKAPTLRNAAISALWPVLALTPAFGAAAWAQAQEIAHDVAVTKAIQQVQPQPIEPAVQRQLVWGGADVDGDGQGDFTNPTGKPVRACDDYGCGEFGASRDGGGRQHQGVDYDASAGQAVDAPISGFVSKVGEAYADDGRYRYVEITNPALRYSARVFYVTPLVREGQPVRIGQPIGRARSLEPRYPGITNHVHLEISRQGGRRIDSERLITASWRDVRVPRA